MYFFNGRDLRQKHIVSNAPNSIPGAIEIKNTIPPASTHTILSSPHNKKTTIVFKTPLSNLYIYYNMCSSGVTRPCNRLLSAAEHIVPSRTNATRVIRPRNTKSARLLKTEPPSAHWSDNATNSSHRSTNATTSAKLAARSFQSGWGWIASSTTTFAEGPPLLKCTWVGWGERFSSTRCNYKGQSVCEWIPRWFGKQ